MLVEHLSQYQTTPDDIDFVIAAAEQHASIKPNNYLIPADPSLRVPCKLFIVVDTQKKVLLLPPNLPSEAYRESLPVDGWSGWYQLPAAFTPDDQRVWLTEKKLGSYTAWDEGLNLKDGAPEWEGVRQSLAHEAVWDPTVPPTLLSRQKTIPAGEFTAPLYRYEKTLAKGFKVPIFPELLVSMAHEAGSHINIMARVQSWPDGHGDDNSLSHRDLSFLKLLEQFSIKIPQVAMPMWIEMSTQMIAHKKYIHELLAYLSEHTETGLAPDASYTAWSLEHASPKNIFGLTMASAIIEQLGPAKAAKFGNSLIDQMIRDLE